MAGLSLSRSIANRGGYGGVTPAPAPSGPGSIPGKQNKPITPAQAYSESIPQQTSDYSDMMSRFRSALDRPSGVSSLMQNYQNLLSQAQQPRTDFSSLTRGYEDILGREAYVPEDQTYERSEEMAGAFGNLSELARTGGYSDQAIADLRARGVSPIRSVYANAMRNLNRQKSLQGGYNPGGGAAIAKMAREQAGLLSGRMTDINAGIAEQQAAGRLSAAPQLVQFAGQETGLMNEIARQNLAARERGEGFNLQRELAAMQGLTGIKGMESEEGGRSIQEQLAALSGMSGLEQFGAGKESDLLRGMTSLFGTTPALANTFGNQTLSAAELDSANKARGITPLSRGRTGGLNMGGKLPYYGGR